MELCEADKLVYIGKTYFEYFEKGNKCELGVTVFDDKVKEIELNGIKLNNNTTSEILATHFPDCKETGEISIYKDETIYQTCSVGINDCDMRILFFLTKDKLKRIDVWYPS